jgi:L-lactate dehydrogenase
LALWVLETSAQRARLACAKGNANALVLLGEPASIVLFDRNLSKAEGQAWDINDAIPLFAQMDLMPSHRYDDLADSDIIVVTIGASHRLRQTRLDVLETNAAILCSLVQELDCVAPMRSS